MRHLHHNSAAAVAAVAIGLTVILFFEWHTDEPMVVLPILLLASFGAGWIAPKNYIIVGLCLGFSILAAHALSNETGLMVPRYQKQPPSVGDWVAMALLVIPALFASFGGSRASQVPL